MKKLTLAGMLLVGVFVQSTAQAAIITDPAGDAVDYNGAGGTLHDLQALEYRVIGTDLFVSLSFNNPIAAASAGAPNSVVGLIEFDVDQNPLTGIAPLQNGFFTPANLGIDYFVDLFDEQVNPGVLNIVEALTDTTVGTVAAIYNANSIEMLIPLALLGGDDGVMDATAIVGSFLQPTDAFGSVPAPTTLALLALLPLALRRR